MSEGAVAFCLCWRCMAVRGEIPAAGWVCPRCAQRRCLLDEREAEELRGQRTARSPNDAPG
jgi:sulfur relay (sulfurtransferase) complex TusBCD TusD component (DsrE family)